MVTTLDKSLEFISPKSSDRLVYPSVELVRYSPPYNDPEILANWGRIGGATESNFYTPNIDTYVASEN